MNLTAQDLITFLVVVTAGDSGLSQEPVFSTLLCRLSLMNTTLQNYQS